MFGAVLPSSSMIQQIPLGGNDLDPA